MDLAASTWESDPSLPLAAIDRMRLQPDAAAPQLNFDRLRAEREELVATTAARLTPDERQTFNAALKAAEVFLPAREKTKLASVMVLHEGRMALRELGRRMTISGVFEQVEDFAMLCLSEFRDFLADPHGFADTIRHRRQWLDELSRLEPPFITVGQPPPPSTWPLRSVAAVDPASVGECIEAIAACPGVVTGRARVVRNPSECAHLEPGDVLVAPSTDPSWTPLFLAASAVVVDVGAPLSHAAIVSRELGIPCVVSALHASRRIRDGAMITVDGTRGNVTVISQGFVA
jgi:pyruvate,water dikinase